MVIQNSGGDSAGELVQVRRAAEVRLVAPVRQKTDLDQHPRAVDSAQHREARELHPAVLRTRPPQKRTLHIVGQQKVLLVIRVPRVTARIRLAAVARSRPLGCHAGKTFGETVDPVAVQAGLFRANQIETNDFATIRVEAADGRELYFHVTHVSEKNVNPISRIEGDGGTIDYTDNGIDVTLANGETTHYDPTPAADVRKNIFDALLKRLEDPKQFICTIDIAAKHTLISNAVFDSVPGVAIPADAIQTSVAEDGVSRLVVPGIDGAIRRAWEENRLVDTRDFAWAAPGSPFPLDGYRGFVGTWFQGRK